MAIPLLNVDANSAEIAILELVRDRCLPDLEVLYVQLGHALFDANVNYHLDELDLLWAKLNDQDIDPTDIVPSVDAVLRMSAERALSLCGIQLAEEVPLEYLIEVCEIILNFDPTDTPSVILSAIDASDDDEECLVKLLSYQGTYEEDQWYPYIESVDSGFVQALRRNVKYEVEVIEATAELPVGEEEQLKRLARLVKMNRDSLGAELGSINVGIGASMESLYGCHAEQLLDLSVEHQVDSLFSLAAISSESYATALTSIGESLDDLIIDLSQRQQAEKIKTRLAETYRGVFGESQ